jgi:hypothetical protein
VHSEDAVVLSLVLAASVASSASSACSPKGPSPSAALEGDRARGGRDGGRVANDDEEDARQDREALDAGISLRALSCKTDRECLTHRCEPARNRCRFPCRSDDDCQPGTTCAVDAGALAACFRTR